MGLSYIVRAGAEAGVFPLTRPAQVERELASTFYMENAAILRRRSQPRRGWRHSGGRARPTLLSWISRRLRRVELFLELLSTAGWSRGSTCVGTRGRASVFGAVPARATFGSSTFQTAALCAEAILERIAQKTPWPVSIKSGRF